MANSPTIPEGVTDEESADAFLSSSFVDEGEPPAPAAVADPPADPPEQTRDDQGRFTSEEPPVVPAQSPEQLKSEPQEAATDESQPGPDAETEVTPDEGLTDEEWDKLPAYQYRAEGRSWEIPGSKVYEDGVHIPAAQMPWITDLVQKGQAHQGSFRSTLNAKDLQVQAMTTERDAAQAALDQISTKITELIESPGAFETWVENQRGNWATLQADAKAAVAQTSLDALNAQNERTAAEAAEAALIPKMHRALGEYVAHFGAEAGFSQEVQQGIYNRLSQEQFLDQIFPRQEGGGRLENPDMVAQEILYLAQIRGPQSAVTEQKGGTVQADQQAAIAAAQPAAKGPAPQRRRHHGPPPVASARAGGEALGPQEQLEIPKFKSTEEADAWVSKL